MTAAPPSFDSQAFKHALGRFPTGVTIVTAQSGDDLVGLTVSSFNSVSLDPPLVVWSLKCNSHSLTAFEQCERYVIQVLAADQQLLAKRFASGTSSDRFAGQAMVRCPGGSPRLDEPTAAWFECYNRDRYVQGDHIVLIGQVEHCEHHLRPPLIYHGGGFDLTPTAGA